MKTITKIVAVVAATFAFNASAANMPAYIESALVDVCKSAIKDNTAKFNKKVKSYNMKTFTVASKVMCNGQDIATFAAINGNEKVAQRLNRSLGSVSISDIALNK